MPAAVLRALLAPMAPQISPTTNVPSAKRRTHITHPMGRMLSPLETVKNGIVIRTAKLVPMAPTQSAPTAKSSKCGLQAGGVSASILVPHPAQKAAASSFPLPQYEHDCIRVLPFNYMIRRKEFLRS